jgi:pimeloyl-ACP methyl ester carboxylesterase
MAHFSGRGFRIHFVEQGDGPAVVFAHGFVMDHTMYAAQFEELPSTYRCIAWDMRGHGRSECPPPPWSMQDLVVDLIAFIEDAKAAPCHLVGMSIGGMIALRVAIQREDLLRSLVLIDTSAEVEDPETLARYREFRSAMEAEDGIPEQLGRDTIGLFYAPSFMEREPEAVEIHIDRETKLPATAAVEGMRVLIDRDTVVDRLGEIRVPTLVIHGELDAAILMERAEQMAAGIPGAELIRVPDAGHTTPLEAPDVVNQALAGFFSRVKR